ncbi:protein BTN1-like [Acropora millepora]|uniref:protein BTN1-like n=1 Tax=Acropora millepora TaxID=45264 RepID=UPI001CF3E75F|nr:protein BTN1-like [Acropora millepora]
MEQDSSQTRFPNNGNDKEKAITTLAFFAFGLILYAIDSVIIAAAQDILAGSEIPTSAVLSCVVGPYTLITLVCPYFVQKIPYLVRIVVVFVLYVCGLFRLVYTNHVEAKLLAVCFVSFAVGVGEMSSIAMTSFYNKVVIGVFSAGTRVGFIASPLYYTAMTTWLCVSPEKTTLTSIGLVVLNVVFYFLMERKHSNSIEGGQQATHKDFTYEKIPEGSNTDASNPPVLTRDVKLKASKEICPSMMCVAISLPSEFLVMQAVLTTYAFPNSPFPPRDHYQYYLNLFLLGELIGRSYLALVSFVKEELVPKLMVKKLWALTIVEVCILIFCLFATWYRFLPDITTLLLLSFLGGLIIGIIYANVLQVFTESYEFPLREFVLGFVAFAVGIGMFAAGLLGLVVEPLLRQHCLTIADLAEYCFTRTDPNAAFNVTSSCHK